MAKVAEKKAGRTVRDFRNYLLRLSGGEDHYEFIKQSDAHRAFWEKLNRMGARNIKGQPLETVPNIDATVVLSNDEWEKLDSELQQLL